MRSGVIIMEITNESGEGIRKNIGQEYHDEFDIYDTSSVLV